MSADDDTRYRNGEITTREYIEAILDEREKASELAQEVLNERLRNMNEFREQIQRERGTYRQLEACELRHGFIDKTLAELRQYVDRRFGEQSSVQANMEGRWLATVAVLTLAFGGIVAFVVMQG